MKCGVGYNNMNRCYGTLLYSDFFLNILTPGKYYRSTLNKSKIKTASLIFHSRNFNQETWFVSFRRLRRF